jgi:hypothetical protein
MEHSFLLFVRTSKILSNDQSWPTRCLSYYYILMTKSFYFKRTSIYWYESWPTISIWMNFSLLAFNKEKNANAFISLPLVDREQSSTTK